MEIVSHQARDSKDPKYEICSSYPVKVFSNSCKLVEESGLGFAYHFYKCYHSPRRAFVLSLHLTDSLKGHTQRYFSCNLMPSHSTLGMSELPHHLN